MIIIEKHIIHAPLNAQENYLYGINIRLDALIKQVEILTNVLTPEQEVSKLPRKKVGG